MRGKILLSVRLTKVSTSVDGISAIGSARSKPTLFLVIATRFFFLT